MNKFLRNIKVGKKGDSETQTAHSTKSSHLQEPELRYSHWASGATSGHGGASPGLLHRPHVCAQKLPDTIHAALQLPWALSSKQLLPPSNTLRRASTSEQPVRCQSIATDGFIVLKAYR